MVNLSSPPIHHPTSYLCHFIYPHDQKKAALLITNVCTLCLRDPSQVRQHTKTSAGPCVSELFWWPFLSETLLMWLNAGRGWNLRCGVLFLSETILITLPSTPPTKHPSNKQGKRSQFVMHMHTRAHTRTHRSSLHIRISVLLFFIL